MRWVYRRPEQTESKSKNHSVMNFRRIQSATTVGQRRNRRGERAESQRVGERGRASRALSFSMRRLLNSENAVNKQTEHYFSQISCPEVESSHSSFWALSTCKRPLSTESTENEFVANWVNDFTCESSYDSPLRPDTTCPSFALNYCFGSQLFIANKLILITSKAKDQWKQISLLIG